MLNRIYKYINPYQLFQILRYASMIVPTIFLSKFLYSQELMGIYESFLIFSGVSSSFWLSALFSTILADSIQDDIKKKNIVLAFKTIHLLSIFVIILLSISNGLHPYIDKYFFLYLLIYIFLNNPSFIIENHFLLFNNNNGLIFYGSLFFILQIICSLIIVILKLDIIYIIYMLVLFALIRYLVAIYIIIKIRINVSIKEIYSLLIKASPLLLSFFIMGIAEYIDAFLIKYNFGNAELNIYRYGSKEIPFILILANSLSMSLIPIMRNNLESGLIELKKRSSYLIHLSFMSSIILVLTCQWWYPFIFNETFKEAIPYFLVSSLLVISRCIFPQTILQAIHQRKTLLIISIFELMLNISLSILFLIQYGAIGIVYGTLVAFTLDKLIQCIYLYQKFGIKPKQYIPINIFSIYSILLLLVVLISKLYIN